MKDFKEWTYENVPNYESLEEEAKREIRIAYERVVCFDKLLNEATDEVSSLQEIQNSLDDSMIELEEIVEKYKGKAK